MLPTLSFWFRTLNYVILVETPLAESAFRFCESLLTNNHKIDCVFFYGAGVLGATATFWHQPLINNIKLYACVKSVEAQGIIITAPIEIAGLATFIAHAIKTERVVQLKQEAQ